MKVRIHIIDNEVLNIWPTNTFLELKPAFWNE